jgi:hypothetical protein
MGAVEFFYRLTGAGWAQAQLRDESATATLTASYINDALELLLEAVEALLDGAAEARCSWAEEPGEYRWILTRDGAQVRARVLWFDSGEDPLADALGGSVFDRELPLRDFAGAIAAGAQSARDEYGEQGYRRLWADEYPFPTGRLQRIHTLLAAGQDAAADG